jgi:hypothetical protein
MCASCAERRVSNYVHIASRCVVWKVRYDLAILDVTFKRVICYFAQPAPPPPGQVQHVIKLNLII